MLQVSAGYVGIEDEPSVLIWLERALPIAERLNLTRQTADGLARLSSVLYRLERPEESLILLRGVHDLAMANGFDDIHRRTRTALTFYEQFADPVAGLAMTREGLEIASRQGSKNYGFLMVGNAVSCSLRVGDWAWAAGLLDEWLTSDVRLAVYLELYADRAVLTTLTGGDATADIAEAERLLAEVTDPQYTSYVHWARSWAALTAGRLDEARTEATTAVDVTPFFAPITLPIAIRAALWEGRLDEARELAERVDASIVRGRAIAVDRITLHAGIASVEGRRTDAVAGYREAIRGWQSLGLGFDEALAGLDLALLLAPTEREMAEAPAIIESTRALLTRLGARPLLARLEAALAGASGSGPNRELAPSETGSDGRSVGLEVGTSR
jgi:tetratricopeptide (TPR) repeat protein